MCILGNEVRMVTDYMWLGSSVSDTSPSKPSIQVEGLIIVKTTTEIAVTRYTAYKRSRFTLLAAAKQGKIPYRY